MSLALAGGILLSGCQPGSHWTWRPDPDRQPVGTLSEDLAACENHAVEVSDNGPPDQVVSAREFGGWGNTDVEMCMAARGWRLTLTPR